MFPAKKLRSTIGTVIMIDWNFSEFVAGILKFFDHFKTDGAGTTFQLNFIEDFPPYQPEITINIPQFETEGNFDHVVINPADQNSYPGIMP